MNNPAAANGFKAGQLIAFGGLDYGNLSRFVEFGAGRTRFLFFLEDVSNVCVIPCEFSKRQKANSSDEQID